MLRSKKGMEMSMNTIIVAVIVLIVMIVMIMLFTGKMGGVRKFLNRTESEYGEDKCKVPGTGRVCIIDEDSCEDRGGFVYRAPAGGWSDCPLGQVCCSG